MFGPLLFIAVCLLILGAIALPVYLLMKPPAPARPARSQATRPAAAGRRSPTVSGRGLGGAAAMSAAGSDASGGLFDGSQGMTSGDAAYDGRTGQHEWSQAPASVEMPRFEMPTVDPMPGPAFNINGAMMVGATDINGDMFGSTALADSMHNNNHNT